MRPDTVTQLQLARTGRAHAARSSPGAPGAESSVGEHSGATWLELARATAEAHRNVVRRPCDVDPSDAIARYEALRDLLAKETGRIRARANPA
jgi:hypothetical protein